MKKFKELSYRIQALIIVLVVLFFIFVVPVIFFFVSYMNSSIGHIYQQLTDVTLPKEYETMDPFKKYEILNAETEVYGRDVLYISWPMQVGLQFWACLTHILPLGY